MTERQAIEAGYEFTGVYVNCVQREEIKARAAAMREEYGCRACVVFIPSNPLSRGGGGGGYSIYADRRYFAKRRLADARRSLDLIPGQRLRAIEEYDKQMKALTDRAEALQDEIFALTEELEAK